MEDILIIVGACIALAILVYLMWRSATEAEWGTLAKNEKRKWRLDEEKRKKE
ncbi:MAG: hypothetical protein NT051_05835 [Candidatus Micrarchaeota archaeon]|nr:hypothetical protein [Candidatus Micrarchaeota archaeon]